MDWQHLGEEKNEDGLEKVVNESSERLERQEKKLIPKKLRFSNFDKNLASKLLAED